MSFEELFKAIANVGLPAVLVVVILFGLWRVARSMLGPAIAIVVKKCVEMMDSLVRTQEKIQETQVEQTACMREMHTSLRRLSEKVEGSEGRRRGKTRGHPT